MIKPDLIYILAKDYEQARKYAWEKGYHYTHMVNVDKREKLCGVDGIELHVLPNAYLRENYPELITLAMTRRITIRTVGST